MASLPQLPPVCAKRFRVIAQIGKGGAGAVFEAIQVDLDRPVALKLLHRQVLADTALVKRFEFEAQVTAQLKHPSIVRIFDHGVEDDIPWIAYEMLPGPTLRQHLAPGPLGWQEAFQIALQVAGALEVAHAAGVLHRDVKPDNVIGAGIGRWKVTDFGIAKTDNYDIAKTASGMLMGTPAYLAPEHITSGTAEPASDLYALGVTLFEMITGTRPFTDPNPIRLLEKHLSQEAPLVSSLVFGVPREVDLLVQRSLAKAPGDRYPGAGAFRRALAEALGPDSSFEVPMDELKAAAKSQVAPARNASTVPAGHLPPPKAKGVVNTEILPKRLTDKTRPAPPPRKAASTAPMAAVGATLVAVAALLWPRAPVPVTPPPSATPSVAAVAHLPDWELLKMRSDLDAIIRGHAKREPDVTALAQAMNPGSSQFAEAVKIATRLAKAEEEAHATLSKAATRLAEEYPDPAAVPDSDAVLYARIFSCRARAWCWHENTRITLDVATKMEAKHGATGLLIQEGVSELEGRTYPIAVLPPTFAALDGISMALERLANQPALITEELGDLFLEINYLNINLSWRKWDPGVLKRVDQRVSRLRTLCATLRPPVGPALGRAAMSLWDLGSTPAGQLKIARERVSAALDELAGHASVAPALSDVRRRTQQVVLAR